MLVYQHISIRWTEYNTELLNSEQFKRTKLNYETYVLGRGKNFREEVKRNNVYIYTLCFLSKLMFYFGLQGSPRFIFNEHKSQETIFCPLNDCSIKLGYSVPGTIHVSHVTVCNSIPFVSNMCWQYNLAFSLGSYNLLAVA